VASAARQLLPLALLAALPAVRSHAPGPPVPRQAAGLEAVPLAAPGGPGARHPRWSRGGDGRLLVTWTAPVDADAAEAVHAVRTAALGPDGFASAVELERGAGHFVNWADAALVTALRDGTLLGAWLAESGAGPYAYGVRLRHTGTAEDGARWLHTDASPTEHGFVSLCPEREGDSGGADAVWLDGRATGAGHTPDGGAGHATDHGGAMALYTRRVAANGALGPERALDERVCDCCQTAAARLADGTLVVAYRDRGADERRDVAFVVLAPEGAGGEDTGGPEPRDGPVDAGAPSAPRPVHVDGWTIDGCPVNGPDLDARGDRVACAWYTEAPGPRVLCAVSRPGADGFEAPVRVDDAPTLGRASIAWLADGSLLVAYLVETDRAEGRGEWRVRRVVDGAPAGEPLVLAEVDATRRSGFLRLAADGDGAVAAWTDVDGGHRLRAARVRVAE
jgi:hypothetical protein